MGKPPERSKPNSDKSHEASGEVVKLEDAIEKVLEGKVQKRDLPNVSARLTQILVSEQFHGPLPHPRHLREYEDICPGAAERIFQMAEKNVDHMREMDQQSIQAEVADQRLGMWIGAGVFVLLIVAAFGTVLIGASSVVTGLFLGTAAIGGVGLFIKGRNGKDEQ